MRFGIDYLQNAAGGGGEVTLPGMIMPVLAVVPV